MLDDDRQVRDELESVASQVSQRLDEHPSSTLSPDAERAGQLVMDARQALQEEVGADRLRSLTAELRQALTNLSP